MNQADGENNKRIPVTTETVIKKKKPSKKAFNANESSNTEFNPLEQQSSPKVQETPQSFASRLSMNLEEIEASFSRRLSRREKKVADANQEKEKSNPENENEKEKEKEKEVEFYFCPDCKEIPRLTMSKETAIHIECRCQKDKPENIIHLEDFLKEMEKPKEIPNCSIENKHSTPVKATKYCPHCKKFYCSSCIKDHDNFQQQHISIQCNGMVINATCEREGCQTKGPIEFYCSTCKVHLCSKCKSEHKKKHQISDLYQIVKDVYFSELEENIAEIEEAMKVEADYYKEIVQLEKVIENCKKLINEREQENKGIIRYFKALINTYKSTRGILNYNIRQNGISSDIKKVYSFSKIHFRFKFKNELVQSKLFKFLTNTKNYYNIVNEYDIKTKEQVKEINKNSIKNVKEKDKEKELLKDYPDYLRILGYYMENKNEYSELTEENTIMLIDDAIVPFTKKFNPNIPTGKHKVEIIFKGTCNTINTLRSMFEGCKSLISSNMSNFNSSSVTDMKRMFNKCLNLSSVNLKNIDTSQVIDMKEMFENCGCLPQIDLSFFETSKVTDMKSMFSGCKALTSLDLTFFDTSKVKDMKQMFYNCCTLKEMDLYNFETPLVEDMKQMFYGCFSLVSLDLSNFNTTEVGCMDEMFCNCASLSDLKVKKECKVKKMKDIFYNCPKLDQATKDQFKKKGFFG